jgi:putative SOS response-associated peptidase YedK
MCNLYSLTKGQQAIRDLAAAMRDVTGNLPLFPGIFPDYTGPIVRNARDGVRELGTARWGMPSSTFALEGRNSDPVVANGRNRTGADGLASRAVALSPSRLFRRTSCRPTLAPAGQGRVRRKPPAGVLRRDLDALEAGS